MSAAVTSRRWVAGLAVAAFTVGIWSTLVEPGAVAIRKIDLDIGAPGSLAGLRGAVLGDIHAGAPHIDQAKLRTLVTGVNASAPDVVVLLGDYVIHGVVGGRFMEPETAAAILGDLRAPGGVFAVLGNHDWWFDGTRVRRALESRGIVVLENEARFVQHAKGGFWLAGLADLWTRMPDIEGALRAVPAGEPVIVLTHSPDLFPEIPSRVSLTLAAHTHGGQVRIPPFAPPVVPSRFGARYAAGHVVEDRRHLFVTTGVGTSIVPVRLAVRPEVVVLTLR